MKEDKTKKTSEKMESEKGKMDPYEKETIIVFNQGDKMASVYTYEKSWQKHFEQVLKIKPEKSDGWGGKTYIVDKKRIRPPRATSSRKVSC